jgi:hypothetical protein
VKAFLMYTDRDFDPARTLIRREQETRYRRGNGDEQTSLLPMLPWNEQSLNQDLAVDVLCGAMAANDRFLAEVAKVALLSGLLDTAAIGYRQRILADCIRQPDAIRAMYQIGTEAINAERKNYWGALARYPAGVLHRAVEILQALVGSLKDLRHLADEYTDRVESEGLRRLFAMLRLELADDYFAEIEEHLRELTFRNGVLVSARLGKGHKGRNHVLRRPRRDNRGWLQRVLSQRPPSYTFHLHPRDEAGARALSELGDRGLNLVANALAQSTDHILSFFQMLRTELGFYVGCLNLRDRLAEIGEPLCFPFPVATGRRTLSFTALYDVSLALTAKSRVVGNDIDADGKDIVIVTGANTGGKSTFLRSVGLAQLMMQAGMFVGAEAFSAELCSGICTHYKREEDATMESGKWDEELSRMSEVVDRIRPNSLMLFNESFASTNQREGAEIAGQIVRALIERGVKVFFVTHLFQFANSFFAKGSPRAVFLRAERRPDGSRPFKLIAAEPLQTSYGEDLYRKIFDGQHIAQEQATRMRGRGDRVDG